MIDRVLSDGRERWPGSRARRAFCLVNKLARSECIERHRAWRKLVMNEAARRMLSRAHCGAAKSTNWCLNFRFVSGEYQTDALLMCRHPLNDDVKFSSIGGITSTDAGSTRGGWSKLDSKGYGRLIST